MWSRGLPGHDAIYEWNWCISTSVFVNMKIVNNKTFWQHCIIIHENIQSHLHFENCQMLQHLLIGRWEIVDTITWYAKLSHVICFTKLRVLHIVSQEICSKHGKALKFGYTKLIGTFSSSQLKNTLFQNDIL